MPILTVCFTPLMDAQRVHSIYCVGMKEAGAKQKHTFAYKGEGGSHILGTSAECELIAFCARIL